jgi:hypothetical protein
MLSYIYSAELKILCNSPGLSGCRGGRLARSENGAPLLIDINKWFSDQFGGDCRCDKRQILGRRLTCGRDAQYLRTQALACLKLQTHAPGTCMVPFRRLYAVQGEKRGVHGSFSFDTPHRQETQPQPSPRLVSAHHQSAISLWQETFRFRSQP